jgi:hypothetical protein
MYEEKGGLFILRTFDAARTGSLSRYILMVLDNFADRVFCKNEQSECGKGGTFPADITEIGYKFKDVYRKTYVLTYPL